VELLKQISLLVFAPTGLRLEAQGCRALTAALGEETRNIFNRNAVASRCVKLRRNRFAVEESILCFPG